MLVLLLQNKIIMLVIKSKFLSSVIQRSLRYTYMQKRIIRIMMGYKSNQSCRELFIKLGILPLPSQFIFSLLLFLNKNRNHFTVNSAIYQYDTRQQSNFHQPPANLTKYQKGICYLGVSVH